MTTPASTTAAARPHRRAAPRRRLAPGLPGRRSDMRTGAAAHARPRQAARSKSDVLSHAAYRPEATRGSGAWSADGAGGGSWPGSSRRPDRGCPPGSPSFVALTKSTLNGRIGQCTC